MPNRLANETSPYLLQHQNNPVDWFPWGPEALERSRLENKPIFLSIGYSACHWCHVMEHESFENAGIANMLNERFVCIKVDREERPDLDHIYMSAVQLMTGRGGWPMSVFLTPDLHPFYGGTYWPPRDSRGMPGFDRIILAVHDAWTNRREQAIDQAARLTEAIKARDDEDSAELNRELLLFAEMKLERAFDLSNGGFGGAPKFPHSMDLQVLLRTWRREPKQGVLDMVRLTLDKMAAGGIYDHLAGGFARYSVDERWLVPHFEKMLYDNALLALVYLEGFLITGNGKYARVARETLDYVLHYMTDEQGGFHSTEDADSEGVEGKFYVWTPAEIVSILGPERGVRFCKVYDVTERGNFEHGQSILNLPTTAAQQAKVHGWNLDDLENELSEDRSKLLLVRDQRVRPGKDDKILTSWNALMIDALAQAAIILEEPGYMTAAEGAAEFLLTSMRRADGRLLHSYRHGQAKLDAYLDDYTYLINALVSLYEASFHETWIDEAVRLAEFVQKHFADPAGGFFYTADDHEELIARHKDSQDSSVPSGNSMAAVALLRLGELTGRTEYISAAESTLRMASGLMTKYPTAAGQMLLALDRYLGPSSEIILLAESGSDERAEILDAIGRRFRPRTVVACRPSREGDSSHLDHLFAGRSLGPAGEPALYICENFVCETPVYGKAAILARLASI